MADSGRICERATPLGRLPCIDERSIECTGQVAMCQASWGGRNLAPYHGKVSLIRDRAGDQGRLWDLAAGRRGGSGHRGGDTCYAPPMSTSLP